MIVRAPACVAIKLQLPPLVLAGTRELVDQLQRSFWDQLPKWIPTHRLIGGEEPSFWDGVTFATIQSAVSKLDTLPTFDLVLIDEAHLIPRSSNTMYRRFLSDLARLDTMVTVVDGLNFLRDYQAADSLASRGETLGEDDVRSISDLLIEQVEFADVLLLSKIDLISQHEREELMAILRSLNARAQIVPMVMGEVPLARILDTGLFDFDQAAQAPGWLQELRGEHVPETEEYGIAASTWQARRPLHPQRFFDFIHKPWTNGRLLRSKGFFWLASKYQEAGSWSQAGGMMRHGMAGRWWRFVPREHWPQDVDNSEAILKHWTVETGDCRQELVFIGQNIDFEKLSTELEACLLRDEEMDLGPMGWLRLDDPFGPWHEEAAA